MSNIATFSINTQAPADLDRLEEALAIEFPAYRVKSADFSISNVTVLRLGARDLRSAAPAPRHLDGWGVDGVVLELIA